MKFDHAMWTLAVALAILNSSNTIAISWWWVASPVILIYAIAAFYALLLLRMRARYENEQRTASRRSPDGAPTGDEGAGPLIILVAAFFGVIALLAMWVDERAKDKQEERAREEAAIMERYGLDAKAWEYMTPEEKALFKR